MQEAARHAQLAVAADRENRLDEAVRHYRECLALMPDEASLQAHRDNYSTRVRLLELRLFERDMGTEPSLADRLKELRDGKESIVNDPTPVGGLEPEEELDSDEQAERVLQQALAEAALGDDDDDDIDAVARKTQSVPSRPAPAFVSGHASDPASSSSEEPYSDEELEKRRLAEKKRREKARKRFWR